MECNINCWNLVGSKNFTECAQCGCCSDDMQTRYKARVRALAAYIERAKQLGDSADVRKYTKQLRYYNNLIKDYD